MPSLAQPRLESFSAAVADVSDIDKLWLGPLMVFIGPRQFLKPGLSRYRDAYVKQLDERQGVKLAICETLAWLTHLVPPTFIPGRATAG